MKNNKLYMMVTLFFGIMLIFSLVACDDGGGNKPGNDTGGGDGYTRENAIELSENIWSTVNFPSDSKELWLKFTATSDTLFIHMDYINRKVELYDSSGTLRNAVLYTDQKLSVTSGQLYYVKVSSAVIPSIQILFNSTIFPPEKLPNPGNTIELTANTWANVTQSDYNDRWFKFTAASDHQVIHYIPGTSTSTSITVFNNGLDAVVTNPQNPFDNKFHTWNFSAASGQVYYIYAYNTYLGTFQIGVNDDYYNPPPSQ